MKTWMKHSSILHNFSITEREYVMCKLVLKYTKEGNKKRKLVVNREFIQLQLDESFDDAFNVCTVAVEKLIKQ